MPFAPARPESRRRKKQADESHAQEHAVGLIGRERLQGVMKERKAVKQTKIIPRGHKFKIKRIEATRPNQAREQQRMRTAAQPEQRGRVPESRGAALHLPNRLQVFAAGSSPSGPISPSTCRTRE